MVAHQEVQARRSRGRAPRAGRWPTARPAPSGTPRARRSTGSAPASAATSRAVRRRSRPTAHTASRARTRAALTASSVDGREGARPDRRRARAPSASKRPVSCSTRSSIRSAACGSPRRARTPGTPRSAASTASTASATACRRSRRPPFRRSASPCAARERRPARGRAPGPGSAASGTGRVARRRTTPTIPHIEGNSTDGRVRHGPPRARTRSTRRSAARLRRLRGRWPRP